MTGNPAKQIKNSSAPTNAHGPARHIREVKEISHAKRNPLGQHADTPITSN